MKPLAWPSKTVKLERVNKVGGMVPVRLLEDTSKISRACQVLTMDSVIAPSKKLSSKSSASRLVNGSRSLISPAMALSSRNNCFKLVKFEMLGGTVPKNGDNTP